MAFATKYKTEIQNWDGDTISAEIQFDGSTATVESFTAVGSNPITIEHQANTNVKESYIIPSKARVSFYVNDEWDCHDLLYVNDREAKLIIKNGSKELFVGWVIAAVNSEAYTTGQYQIRVDAVDGLADLKNQGYFNTAPLGLYQTYRNPSTIINDCISFTGHNLAYWENIDIYAASGMTTTATTHSPLNQSYIHPKAYGDKIETVMTAWDVLESILQAFHCRLYQTSELDGGNNAVWVIAKIDKLATTSTFREWNSSMSAISGSTSYAPLKTLSTAPTEPHHLGGPAQISIQQGFKSIDLVGNRGINFSLLDGYNFNSDDFSGSSLIDWGAPSILTNIISGWSVATYSELTIGNDTLVAIRDTTSAGRVACSFSDNGSGNVRIGAGGHGITTSDWLLIPDGVYKGIWKPTAIPDASSIDISATFDSSASTSGEYRKHTSATCLEYDRAIALDNDQIAVDNDNQFIEINADLNLRYRGGPGVSYPVVIVLVAYVNSTDYKTLNSDGEWVDYNANEVHPVIVPYEATELGNQSITISGSLSDENNFYTGTSHKLYLGIFANYRGTASAGIDDTIRYNRITVSFKDGATKEVATTINTDFVESKKVIFFHTDGAGGDNDEFLYINPIVDDSASRLCINSWQQNAGTADNLEDIIQANLVAAYDDNSQIWSGMIKGDINISHAIKDPLNLNRIFQIQRISKNLENNFNSLSMIEIEPSKAYYLELATGGAFQYLYTASEYGDLTTIFTAGDTIEISTLLRKSDGVQILSAQSATITSTIATGGRTRIVVPLTYDVTVGTDVEIKGMVRKV